MPWYKECRAIDPKGAKLVNDRLRQAQLTEEQLKEKNGKRAQRACEIKAEIKQAQDIAHQLTIAAIGNIDLSLYQGRERREIEKEMRKIRDVLKALMR